VPVKEDGVVHVKVKGIDISLVAEGKQSHSSGWHSFFHTKNKQILTD
jgi:hypothetical protein